MVHPGLTFLFARTSWLIGAMGPEISKKVNECFLV